MQNDDSRRCSACGELSITKARRFVLIGAAAIAGAAATEQPFAFVAFGTIACTLLYGWEFLLTRGAPLEPVSDEEARGYKRNWTLGSVATLVASAAVAFLVTRL